MGYEITEWFSYDKSRAKLGNCIYLEEKDKGVEPARNIDIMIAPDDNYVPHCAALMASILLNCDSTSYIRFHIPYVKISDENKNKLESLKSIRPFDISFYDMSKIDLSGFPLNRDYISVATYYRLFINEFMPKDVERVLYLDCDIIVERDLKELWDINLDGYYAGVCEDECSLDNLLRMKLKSSDFCFNAGVVLFNMLELRKINFTKECIDYYNKNWQFILLQDQDILNGVFDGKCKKMPLCWNAATPFFMYKLWKLTAPSNERFEAIYNPAIIHYDFNPKPWKDDCIHPLADEYYKYLSHTPFKRKPVFRPLKKFLRKIYSCQKDEIQTILMIFGIKIKYKNWQQKFNYQNYYQAQMFRSEITGLKKELLNKDR